MTFDERLEQLKDVVATHFTYNDVFVDKMHRNRRTGVRLAKIKFASYDTNCFDTMMSVERHLKEFILDTGLQVMHINGHRSYAMFTNKKYDSLIVHMVIDKY